MFHQNDDTFEQLLDGVFDARLDWMDATGDKVGAETLLRDYAVRMTYLNCDVHRAAEVVGIRLPRIVRTYLPKGDFSRVMLTTGLIRVCDVMTPAWNLRAETTADVDAVIPEESQDEVVAIINSIYQDPYWSWAVDSTELDGLYTSILAVPNWLRLDFERLAAQDGTPSNLERQAA